MKVKCLNQGQCLGGSLRISVLTEFQSRIEDCWDTSTSKDTQNNKITLPVELFSLLCPECLCCIYLFSGRFYLKWLTGDSEVKPSAEMCSRQYSCVLCLRCCFRSFLGFNWCVSSKKKTGRRRQHSLDLLLVWMFSMCTQYCQHHHAHHLVDLSLVQMILWHNCIL